ncbi:MAG TPA: PAS domain S-box protein, partial [Thermoanaerobaculia bacterium]|nr:PAS domain S-box protein [Thermoanaerobaculia bacterium]
LLRKSEQRYQELADSSKNFIAAFDCHDRYTAANKAVCSVLGLPEEKVIGRTLEEVGFPTAIAEEWRAQMAEARNSGQVQTREMRSVFRQSGARVLHRTVSPMVSDDGTLTGVSAMSIDITEQKASEEKNQKLLRAIEEMDEVMFTTDAAGVITYVNPAFEQVYGFTREEAIGKKPSIIRSGETAPVVYEAFWKELKAGRTVRTEFINRHKDGELVRVVASVSPIHGDDGCLTGFTAVQRDVTAEWRAEEERLKIEEQLARSAKMLALGTLAGGIAHDFNNILSIVMSHATVAEMSRTNPARIGEALFTIKSAVNRGAALSRQILTFARKTEVQFANTDLNRIVREIGSMVREMFPRNIHLDLELGPSLPMIRADSGQLHQVLLNLCLNARDAMPAGGTLRLTTHAIGSDQISSSFPLASNRDHVCLVVSDSGHGMNRETVSRIFEPFFTTKDVGKGSGLGLAVVYGVINAHEGWINVSSEPGLGTTFRLYFPASAAAQVADTETAHASQTIGRGSERLLMIEDEAEIAEALTSQLSDHGYNVVPCTNAEEAVAHLREKPMDFDLILSDLGIPGTSSRDLVRMLRNAAPGLPLIPMTGYIDPELHKDVVAIGSQPILEKPFTIEQLLLRIQEAAGARMS